MSENLSSGMSTYGPSLRLACALIVLAVMICMLTGALAAETVLQHIQKEIPGAHLAGQGSFRWFGLKIYDAKLWVGKDGCSFCYDPQKTMTERIALDLRYARSLSGEKIAQASDEQIEKLGIGSAAQRARWLQKMTQLFPDVNEGTHLTGIYVPQQGTYFYLDGTEIGSIKDEAFSRAFFSIWLAPETSAPQLRQALLQDAAPQ